jgi:hypothetical protein
VYNDDWNSQLQPVYCKHYDDSTTVSEGAIQSYVVPEGEQADPTPTKSETTTTALTTNHNNSKTSHNNSETSHNNSETSHNNSETSHNNSGTTHNNNYNDHHHDREYNNNNNNNDIPAPYTPLAINLIRPEPYGISSFPNNNTPRSNHRSNNNQPSTISSPSSNNNNNNIREPIVQQNAPTPRAIRYDPPPQQQQRQRQQASVNVEPRRSTRVREPIDRLGQNGVYNAYLDIIRNQRFIEAVDVAQAFRQANVNENYIAAFTAQMDEFDGNIDYVDPAVYMHLSQRTPVQIPRTIPVSSNMADTLTRAPQSFTTPSVFVSAVDNDTFRYHEALMQPDWEEFQRAAVVEIQTLEQMGTWEEVPRTSVPTNKRVLGGTVKLLNTKPAIVSEEINKLQVLIISTVMPL